MKKSLLLILLMTLLAPWALRAEEVTVGDSVSVNSYLPMNSLYEYSFTQQIYTADEIGMGGTISSITLWLKGAADLYEMPFDIYMLEVDKEVFSSTSDWVEVSEADIVYSGTVTVHNTAPEAYTFELETPFEYSGSSNLLICFNNTTGQWKSGLNGVVFGASGDPDLAIYARRDNTIYDIASLPAATAVTYWRNVIMFDIAPSGGGAVCQKPESLVVSEVTARNAHFVMEGNGASEYYQFVILRANEELSWDDVEEAPLEEELDVDSLQPLTAYKAYLRAYCGSDEGEQSGVKTVSFTTLRACNVETTLKAKNIEGEATKALLTWLAAEDDVDWEIVYSKKSNLTDSTVVLVNGDTAKILEGLETDSLYYAQVRAFCGEEDGYGLWSNKVSFSPSDKVVIGSGTSTSSYLPFHNNYNYSLTQQIYTAEELGTADAILKIDLYNTSTATTRDLDIYMVYTDKSAFASGTDWIQVTAADKVFSGEVEFVSGAWTTIELDRAFIYDGEQNVAIIIDDNTGDYSGTKSFRSFSATDQALYVYSDGTNYDALNPSSYSGTKTSSKNQIRVLKGEAPTCFKPETLALDSVGIHGAAFHWTIGEAENQWEWAVVPADSSLENAEWHLVSVLEAVAEGLEANTKYDVHVRSYCGPASQSDSRKISFWTNCLPLDAATYAEDFTGSTYYCWTRGNVQAPEESYYYPATGDWEGMDFYAYVSSSIVADSSYAILPELNFGEKSLQDFSLAFHAAAAVSYTYNYDHLLVGVVNGDDISTFEQIADFEIENNAYGKYEVEFGSYLGAGNRIALLAVVDSASTASTRTCEILLKDLELFLTPTCQPLEAISISNIERRSMIVNLLPKTGKELGSYELVYDTVALSADSLEMMDKILISDTNKYQISGLDRETMYYIYVRANCGEDGVSSWVADSASTKGLSACELVEVGTAAATSTYVPLNSLYNYSLSEQIYTPAEIGVSGMLSAMAFYNTGSLKTRTIDLYLVHTTKSAFESATDWVNVTEADKVFSGSVDFTATSWVGIQFDAPFYYNGTDNLLLVVDDHTGTWSSGVSCSTFTSAVENQAMYKYQDAEQMNPQSAITVEGTRIAVKNYIVFEYCYDLVPCPAVQAMSYELIGAGTTEAVIRWDIQNADYLSGYDVILSEEPIEDFTGVALTAENIQVDSIDFDNLVASTRYYVYVRANCQAEGHDEGSSEWTSIDFTTLADCPHVEDLAMELVDANVVSVSWNKAFEEQELHFAYIISEEELDAEGLVAAAKQAVDDTMAVRLEDLDFDQKYYIYVASACGEQYSPWEMDSIQTLPACIQVRNLQADRIEHNRVVLSWQRGIFAKENLWEVGIVGDEANALTISDTTALLIGLEPDSAYVVYVKAICGEDSESEATLLEFTTALNPGECEEFVNGTSTITTTPLFNNYGGEYSVQIYTAQELQAQGFSAGNLVGISYHLATIGNTTTANKYQKTASVWIGNTEKSSFVDNADWITSGLTQVKNEAVVDFAPADSWISLQFDNAFEWDGTSNIAIATLFVSTGSYTTHSFYGGSLTQDTVCIYGYADATTLAVVDGVPNITSSYNKKVTSERPNIMFCFEAGSCQKVGNLSAKNVDKTSAKIDWEPMGSERAWNVLLSEEAVVTDFSAAQEVSAYFQVLDTLVPGTDYYYFVQPAGDCEDDSWNSVHFKTLASCLPPMNPEAGELTTNTAAISWVDGEDAGSYIVAYGVADSFDLEDPETYELLPVVGDTAVVLSDLLPNTAYEFAVKNVCSAEDQSVFSEIAGFHTDCEAIVEFPWIEDFEDYATGSFADHCWSNEHIAGTGTSIFGISTTSNAGNTSHQLYSPYMSTGNAAQLVLPEMNIPAGYQFELDIYRNATGTSYPKEGVRIFAIQGSDSTQLAFISRNYTVADTAHGITAEEASGWYTYELEIPYSGLCNIVIQGEGQGSYTYTYMDNLKVRRIPTCFKPSDLAVVDYVAGGASFTWGAGMNAEGTQWQWAVAAAGEEPEWLADEDHIISDDSVAVSGLEDATSYDFYVRAYCSEADQSDEVKLSFSTLYTVPFEPEFAGTTVPSDWMRSNTAAASVFAGTAMSAYSYGWTMVAGSDIIDTYNFKMNIYGTTNKYWLVTPMIIMPNDPGAEYVLDFELALDAYSSAGSTLEAPDTDGTDDRFLVVISADGGQTWLEANKTEWNNQEGEAAGDYVLNEIGTTATPYQIDMTAYAGQIIRIGFYGESTVSNADNDIHVGHINLHVADGGGTSIKDIWGNDKAVKFFRNGHIYILRNGVIYDATGRMVKRD